jgi:hypothetical protein
MAIRHGSVWLIATLCFSLAACVPLRGRAVLKNSTGVDLVLSPLSEYPRALKAGVSEGYHHFPGRNPLQAFIERGGCLYTYPAPDYAGLPSSVKKSRPRVIVEVRADMRLHLYPLSKEGVQGPEIVAGGFPLKPSSFCGRRGEG